MNLDVSDLFLLAVGVFFAVTSLVRLMRNRRDELVQQLTQEAESMQQQKKSDEKKQKKPDGKRKAA